MKLCAKKINTAFSILVLIILFINNVIAADIDCNTLEYSLHMCKYDEYCKNNFFLDYNGQYKNYNNSHANHNNDDISNYDRMVFEVNLEILMTNMEIYDFLKQSSLCNNSDISHMWLKILQNHIICDHNEVYELYFGCICIEGKVCGDMEKDIPYRYQNSHIIIILSLIFGIILFFTTESIKTIFEIESIIKNIYKK